MNRILLAAASALLLTGAAVAQEPWASSIQTEGSPSNAELYGLETVVADPAYSFGKSVDATIDRTSTASVGTPANGRPTSAPNTEGGF